MESHETARNLFLTALDRFAPSTLTEDALHRVFSDHPGWRDKEMYLLATGKASLEMAAEIRKVAGKHLKKGLVITGYHETNDWPETAVLQGSHPVPDEKSEKAAAELVSFVENVPADSLLVYAISGGTSSLLCYPAKGITISDLGKTYGLLNQSGANIYEINNVRKHLSRVKGGHLLRHLDPSVLLLDLIISDVPNDNPEYIGSGPTTTDMSTFQDAYHILLEYELWERIPAPVRKYIERGIDGIEPETLQPGEDPIEVHEQRIIGSPRKLAEKVLELAEDQDFNTWMSQEPYNDDVEEVAEKIARQVRTVADGNGPVDAPAVLVFFGESTVRVTGNGRGGRNQELALRAAREIDGYKNVIWLSGGTDGIDGPTDAAGAVVDGNTYSEAEKKRIDPVEYLNNNDSYRFHEQMGTLMITGPTGNNLMDLQIVIVD